MKILNCLIDERLKSLEFCVKEHCVALDNCSDSLGTNVTLRKLSCVLYPKSNKTVNIQPTNQFV